MYHILLSILSLLLGTALLLFGIGLQGTLLALRAGVEGFSVNAIGVVMSAYFLGYAIGTRYCPALIREVGHIRSYAVLATIASAAAVAYPLFPSPPAWFLLRLVTGICIVGLFLVIESWLNEVAPSQSRGRFFAVYMLINLLALAVAQFMILLGDIAGFDLFAITTILLSIALVPVAMTRVRQPEVIESAPVHLATLYRDSPLGVAGTLIAGIVSGAFWGMAPVFASGIGLEALHIALLLCLTVAGGALLQWPVGLLSDRFDRRTVLTTVTLLGALVALFNYRIAGHSEPLLLAGSFLFGAFAFSLYALSVAHVNDRLAPGQALEAAKGLLQVFGFGAASGPFLAGYAMELWGYRALMLFFTGWMLLLGLFALVRMRLSEAPAPEEQVGFVPMSRTTPVALEMDPRLEEGEAAPPPASG